MARCVVSAGTGYSLQHALPSTTYAILDSDYCFEEVARFAIGGVVPELRKREADECCARLNAEHEAWLHNLDGEGVEGVT